MARPGLKHVNSCFVKKMIYLQIRDAFKVSAIPSAWKRLGACFTTIQQSTPYIKVLLMRLFSLLLELWMAHLESLNQNV